MFLRERAAQVITGAVTFMHIMMGNAALADLFDDPEELAQMRVAPPLLLFLAGTLVLLASAVGVHGQK